MDPAGRRHFPPTLSPCKPAALLGICLEDNQINLNPDCLHLRLANLSTVAAVGDGLDYAVIKFDPAKAIPTANFAGFAINGIGPAPDWHQPACTDGAANGTRCGGISSIPGPGPRSAMSRALFQPGDDGGPVTSNDLLIGLVYGGNSTPANVGMPQIDFTRYTKFSAIQDDVNAKDGPGAGFSPIVA